MALPKKPVKTRILIKPILSLLLLSLCSTCIFSCNNIVVKQEVEKPNNQFPQKHEMIVLSDRPPQLETPLPILRQDITPNADFFVRWHLSQIINKIDIDTFRLYVGGEVQKPLALSMTDLKTSFPIDSLIAVAVCAGNGRSFFNPQVPGLQWKNGGIGNAKWKGVKLSTILKKAGISNKAVDITFQGMDVSPMPGIPPYVRSINSEHAMAGEVLVAFEMNGEELPILNGYPLKLVVPG
jgi:DMSO/TMAO reductase YedYZ molybdopterin-dependent catalytic subunit